MPVLNLPNVQVTQRDEYEDRFVYHAQSILPVRICPGCQSKDSVLIGKKIQPYIDAPMHTKTVKLSFTRKRLKCKACNRTYLEPLEWLHGEFRMTKRVAAYIAKRATKIPFLNVASELAIDEKTVRNVFSQYVAEIEHKHDWIAPRILGIDETHFSNRMHLVMTDIERKTLLDIRKSRTKEATKQAIVRLVGWKQIEIVCIDMWRPYRDAVGELLPKAVVVIDRFHIARMANEAMEQARKDLRQSIRAKTDHGAKQADIQRELKQLKRDRKILLKRRDNVTGMNEINTLHFWTTEYPDLMDVYNAKEAFLGMWDMPTREEAEAYWQQWLDVTPLKAKRVFKPLITAMSNWHTEIFNYWDYPHTNAFTESLNNLIKTVYRSGRGYSFEVLRAKLLYTKGAMVLADNSPNKPQEPLNQVLFVDEPELSVHGMRHELNKQLLEKLFNN